MRQDDSWRRVRRGKMIDYDELCDLCSDRMGRGLHPYSEMYEDWLFDAYIIVFREDEHVVSMPSDLVDRFYAEYPDVAQIVGKPKPYPWHLHAYRGVN